MLELPADWKRCATAHVVAHLLRQAEMIGFYHEAALAMTRAAIEFMIAGPRWSHCPKPIPLISRPDGWQLNSWLFHVLPGAEDQFIDALDELPEMSDGIDVLAPPWSKFFVKRAVHAAFPDRSLDVLGVDDFCQYRLLWTGIDLNQGQVDSVRDFMERYRGLTQSVPAISLAPVFDTPTD